MCPGGFFPRGQVSTRRDPAAALSHMERIRMLVELYDAANDVRLSISASQEAFLDLMRSRGDSPLKDVEVKLRLAARKLETAADRILHHLDPQGT